MNHLENHRRRFLSDTSAHIKHYASKAWNVNSCSFSLAFFFSCFINCTNSLKAALSTSLLGFIHQILIYVKPGIERSKLIAIQTITHLRNLNPTLEPKISWDCAVSSFQALYIYIYLKKCQRLMIIPNCVSNKPCKGQKLSSTKFLVAPIIYFPHCSFFQIYNLSFLPPLLLVLGGWRSSPHSLVHSPLLHGHLSPIILYLTFLIDLEAYCQLW